MCLAAVLILRPEGMHLLAQRFKDGEGLFRRVFRQLPLRAFEIGLKTRTLTNSERVIPSRGCLIQARRRPGEASVYIYLWMQKCSDFGSKPKALEVGSQGVEIKVRALCDLD